ncbi:MAG: S8 family serine peptidase [Chloroflexi bacterium]|nr:S8 family serine peptidase [Chloroflexota bacterium]
MLRRWMRYLALATLAVLFALSTLETSIGAEAREIRPGRLVVRLRQGASAPSLDRRSSAVLGEERVDDVLGYRLVRVTSGQEPAARDALRRDPAVESVEYDFVAHALLVPSDPYYPQQWGLARINAPSAWDRARGTGVLVAIVDTGIDLDHPDLVARIAPGGLNFVAPGTPPADDNGHGTHVAGIAAASLNGLGVVGVAPEARLLPIKVLDASGSGSYYDIMDSIRYAADQGARVINLSLGGLFDVSYLRDAVNYARARGAVVVAAAGNDPIQTYYPAAYPGVVAVSAVDSGDRIAAFSSRGSYIGIAAPGVTVASTAWRGSGESYVSRSGTSMAAPHVAGVVALVRGVRPALSGDEAVGVLKRAAYPLGDSSLYGAGLLDAAAAVHEVTTLTASQSTVLLLAPGGVPSLPTTVVLRGGSGSFSTSVQPNGGWLTVQPASSSFASDGAATLRLTSTPQTVGATALVSDTALQISAPQSDPPALTIPVRLIVSPTYTAVHLPLAQRGAWGTW